MYISAEYSVFILTFCKKKSKDEAVFLHFLKKHSPGVQIRVREPSYFHAENDIIKKNTSRGSLYEEKYRPVAAYGLCHHVAYRNIVAFFIYLA